MQTCKRSEGRGSSGFKDLEAQERNLVINFLMDRKPMQMLMEWGDIIKFGTAEDKSSTNCRFEGLGEGTGQPRIVYNGCDVGKKSVKYLIAE